jgi:haloalkane dehalogenase
MQSSRDADLVASTNERRVDTPEGRVFVRQTAGDDPPIVLMHGFPDDHRIYNKLLPRLAPRRAVAFDFLGYGRSDRTNAARFCPEQNGAQLTAVLNELGITSAVLVGHDASGPDAVLYAVAHPERVAHLVLLNTIFGHQKSLKMPEMTRLFAEPELASLADDMVNDPDQRLWLLQRWGIQWELDADDPGGLAMQSIVPQFFGDADQPDALAAIRAWTAGLFDSLEKQDALIDSGALRHLEVPVSIIFGEKDRYLNPSLAAELAGLFNNPSLQIVQDAGHYPQDDQPEVVADCLKRL